MTKEIDTNYAHSKTLQEHGVSLTRVATEMFNFRQISADGGEYYLTNPADQEIFCVNTNSEGLQVGMYAFGHSGRPLLNTVRFVMEHGNHRSPLDAISSVRKHFKLS